MPLSPSETRRLLAELEHRPRKPLGQNFLIDGNIVRKSLQLAGVQPGDRILEIGPGLGTLTEALLEAGAEVHAVELDRRLAGYLRETLQPRFPEAFHLLEADAVEHPRGSLPASVESFKVVANLPYAITTPWIERMLAAPLPRTLVLMMQKEAADRLTASPGSKAFGAVSIFLSAAYQRAGLHRVSRSCFHPVPGVDSQLLHLERRPTPFLFSLPARAAIRGLFTQRRKQIGHLLQGDAPLQPWLEILPRFNCSRTSRPENIPLEVWLEFPI